MRHAIGQVRAHDKHVSRPLTDFQFAWRGHLGRVFEDWLFKEKHARVFRSARHQVLWTLKDKVPPQMRKANNIVIRGFRGAIVHPAKRRKSYAVKLRLWVNIFDRSFSKSRH